MKIYITFISSLFVVLSIFVFYVLFLYPFYQFITDYVTKAYYFIIPFALLVLVGFITSVSRCVYLIYKIRQPFRNRKQSSQRYCGILAKYLLNISYVYCNAFLQHMFQKVEDVLDKFLPAQNSLIPEQALQQKPESTQFCR